MNASFDLQRWRIGLQLTQRLIAGGQHLLVVFFAALMIIEGSALSLGMLVAFLAFRQTFTDRATSFIAQVTEFRLMGAHLDRISDIVLAEPEAGGGYLPGAAFEGGYSLRGLSFRYGSSSPPILNCIDLDIIPGEFVAIVGPSGNGKTTLVKILIGQLHPTDGVLELDGHLATPALFAAWRRQVGYVAQDDRLLSGSVAENVGFFDPDLDMHRVREVCELAQIDREIERLPMQYLTRVGDMGSALSGGQRQRVLLARALYRRPRLLILDEGTANIDEALEGRIADMVRDLKMTRIVIAHRPRLPLVADRVFELSDKGLRQIDRADLLVE